MYKSNHFLTFICHVLGDYLKFNSMAYFLLINENTLNQRLKKSIIKVINFINK